jgi:hypothetical protein
VKNLEEGILKLGFVKSIENKSDIFTKNGLEKFNMSLIKVKEYSKDNGDSSF